MDRNKIIAGAVLAIGVIVWRVGAMQQGNNQIEIEPNDGPVIRMNIDRACLSGTIKNLYDTLQNEAGEFNEPMPVSVSTADLNAVFITEEPQILAAHAAFNDRTLAAISALPEEVRKERARRAASLMAQTPYNAELLNRTMKRFQVAVYLDIPELYERDAKIIADMLISDVGLAALSGNAAILNEFTVALETAVANYIPELWLEACTLRGHTNWVISAAFSPDGTLVVTVSMDNTAKIWNAATGAMVRDLDTGEVNSALKSAAFSPDGTLVVTLSGDNTAKIWNAATGAMVRNLVGHTGLVNSAVFSPDGTLVVTASWDRTAKIWNAATGAMVRDLVGHTNWVISAAFSPDGTRVVTASDDNTAKIWNAATGAMVRDLVGHTAYVQSAKFSPDGTKVVTASVDRTAKIWNAATGAMVRDLVGHTEVVSSAVFSPDGTQVVTASYDKTAKIWNAATGAMVRNLVGHTDVVCSAVFSPDGRRVVTASADNTAKIWNAATGALVWNLVGHTGAVFSAVFSPDGTQVVTASYDKTAKIWQLLPSSLPGVNDFDATLFAHLLFWAQKNKQKITDTSWAPKVVHAIKWHMMRPADKQLLQGWIREAMQH